MVRFQTPGLKREEKRKNMPPEWSMLHRRPPGLPPAQLHRFSHPVASLSPASWLEGRGITSRAEQLEDERESRESLLRTIWWTVLWAGPLWRPVTSVQDYSLAARMRD